MDPQSDFLIQPKPRELLHMECNFWRTTYMKIILLRFQDYLGWSTTQPQYNQESTLKTCSSRSWRDPKTASEVLGSLHNSATKSSGDLSDQN